MPILFHVLNACKALVIIDAVFSWIVSDDTFPRVLTKPILEPLYGPIRSIVSPGSRLDLSPLVVLVVLYAFDFLLRRGVSQAPR